MFVELVGSLSTVFELNITNATCDPLLSPDCSLGLISAANLNLEAEIWLSVDWLTD
jgi:hypothetical protein